MEGAPFPLIQRFFYLARVHLLYGDDFTGGGEGDGYWITRAVIAYSNDSSGFQADPVRIQGLKVALNHFEGGLGHACTSS